MEFVRSPQTTRVPRSLGDLGEVEPLVAAVCGSHCGGETPQRVGKGALEGRRLSDGEAVDLAVEGR